MGVSRPFVILKFVFTSPGPNLYLLTLASNMCLPTLTEKKIFAGPGSSIVFTNPGSGYGSQFVFPVHVKILIPPQLLVLLLSLALPPLLLLLLLLLLITTVTLIIIIIIIIIIIVIIITRDAFAAA